MARNHDNSFITCNHTDCNLYEFIGGINELLKNIIHERINGCGG